MSQAPNVGIGNDIAKFNWFETGMPDDLVLRFFAGKDENDGTPGKPKPVVWDPAYKEYFQTAMKNVKLFAINWKAYFTTYNEILKFVDGKPLDIGFIDGFIEDLEKYQKKVDAISDTKSAEKMVAEFALLKANYIDRLLSMEFCKRDVRIENAEREQNPSYVSTIDPVTCSTNIVVRPVGIKDPFPVIDLKTDSEKIIGKVGAGTRVSLKKLIEVLGSSIKIDNAKSLDKDELTKLQSKVDNITQRIKDTVEKLSSNELLTSYEENKGRTSIMTLKWTIISIGVIIVILTIVLIVIYFTVIKGGKGGKDSKKHKKLAKVGKSGKPKRG